MEATEEDIWNSYYVVFHQSAEKMPKTGLSYLNSLDMFLKPGFFFKHVMEITCMPIKCKLIYF